MLYQQPLSCKLNQLTSYKPESKMKLLFLIPLLFLFSLTAGCKDKTPKKNEAATQVLQEILKKIEEKDSLALKDLLHNFDVNAFDSAGVNLLTHSVMTGDINLVKMIGLKGADPNLKNKTAMGSTPLMMASEFKSLEIARYLLELGARVDIQDNNGDPAINWSAYYGNIPFTKLMLDHGARTDLKSIHSDGVMQVALKEWQNGIVDLLLDYGVTIQPVQPNAAELIQAVKNDNLPQLQSLLNDTNMDARDGAGNTLLMIAAEKGYLQLVKTLVTRGAGIDAMNSVGQTALNKAVYFGKNAVAKFLVTRQADVNKTDTRFILPPLVAAIRGNNLEMGELLLARGADVNITDGTNNFSPIMWAALYQNKAFILLLKKYKPDLSIISKYKTTVFDMTTNPEILALLKSGE